MSKLSTRTKPLAMVGLTAALAVALTSLAAQAACPSWPTIGQANARFTVAGSNNDEVTDQRTGLTWKRCSAGQAWSGSTCTGSATTHTHEAALALAKAANTSQSATGWRLPNVKELASLADKGCQNPAIDSTAFPATPPSNWFWSSSPVVGGSSYAWSVPFSYGNVYDHGSRNLNFHVRLVRASQ